MLGDASAQDDEPDDAAVPEVMGFPGSLLEALDTGVLAEPGPLDWNAWTSWRSGVGKAPTFAAMGGRQRWCQREAKLRREVLAHLYGAQFEQLARELRRSGGAAAGAATAAPAAAAVAAPLDLGDGGSSATSRSSWSGLASATLLAKARVPFSPETETLQQYEGRLVRAVALLEARGEPVPEDELAMHAMRARLLMEIAGQPDAEAVRTLRGRLARLLEDDDQQEESSALAEVLVAMIGERTGGRGAGPLLQRLLFTPSSGASGVSAGRAEEAGALAGIAEAGPANDTQAGAAPRPTPQVQAAPADGTALEAAAEPSLAQAVLQLAQAAAASRDRDPSREGEQRSTITVRPHMEWPSLGDDDHDVEDFFDRFEETVGLANDCKGMNSREKLRVLRSCLKQSRAKVYDVVLKAARANGDLEANPKAVYDRVKGRLMEFRETQIEQQTRADRVYEQVSKGKSSAVQFLPVWEAAVAELELRGLGKSDRELLLGYLKRVGAYRTEILKDRRPYRQANGVGEEVRQVKTWREAHSVLVEIEQLGESSRALVGGTFCDEGADRPGRGKRRRGKPVGGESGQQAQAGQQPGGVIGAVTPDHLKKVCWDLRDKGKCERPNCTFDHDERRIKEARLAKDKGKDKGKGKDAWSQSSHNAWNSGGAEQGRGKGGKSKGKDGKGDRGDKGGKGKEGAVQKSSELCRLHLAGSCRFGADCKFQHSDKAINALSRAIASYQGAPPAGAGAQQQWQQPQQQSQQDAAQPDPWGTYLGKGAGAPAAAVQGGPQMAFLGYPPGVPWPAGGPWLGSPPQQQSPAAGQKMGANGQIIYGPLWEGPPPQMRAEAVYQVQPGAGHIRSLADLPRAAWTRVARPSSGYNYRTMMEVAGLRLETLLDTGAATSVIAEETVVEIFHASPGMDPLPIVTLEEWGEPDEATGVARGAPLRIIGSVVLLVVLLGIDGRRVEQPFRFKIFGAGCCGWRGLIIGGPALEQAPLGVGYRPSLAGHVFEKIGLVLPRLEESRVLSRVDTLGCIFPIGAACA